MRSRSYHTASLLILTSLFFLCAVSFAFAQGSGSYYTDLNGGGTSLNGSAQLKNPLQYDSLDGVVSAILQILIIFAIPIIILFIIYAGFLYVTSRGNESTIEKAHYALLYAVIGGIIILGAEAILLAIKGTVSQLY